MRNRTLPTDSPPFKLLEIGQLLHQQFGAKKYFTKEELFEVLQLLHIVEKDATAQAMALYCTHAEFNEYHRSVSGEYYYTEMRIELKKLLTDINLEDFSQKPKLDLGFVNKKKSTSENVPSESNDIGLELVLEEILSFL